MGFAGSSIHVRGHSQESVAGAICKRLATQGFRLVCESPLQGIPNEEKQWFRQDKHVSRHYSWGEPHAERPHRAFVVAPPLNGWVSIFERGEFREIALAEFLSKELSTYVAASLWEEHTGEQIFHGFRGGHLEDAFIQEHFQAKVSKMGALSNVTPERFALDEYMHVELQITIGYCTTFSDMFLHPEEACSLAEMLYLSFRRD